MANTYNKVQIHEALELLNEIAAGEESELKDMIADRYDALKGFVGAMGATVQRDVSHAYRAGKEKVQAAACQVDDHVHANPWAYIGGSAAVGLLVGFLISRGRR